MTEDRERKILFKRASRKDLFDNWPSEWPSQQFHAIQHDVSRAQYCRFVDLVRSKPNERQIEAFLGENREVLALAIWMYSTGHHMAWIFPKRQIKASGRPDSGLIPDYILAGASSGGIEWFILELKGADTPAFSRRGKHICLSPEANAGVCQLLNYIDVSSRDQAYLRDGLKLSGFREPRGILLIGTDDETDDTQIQSFKSAWNRINSRVQIRSYNFLLRQVEQKLRDFGRL